MIVILEFGIMVLLASAPCSTQRRHILDIRAECCDSFPNTKPHARRDKCMRLLLCQNSTEMSAVLAILTLSIVFQSRRCP